MSYCRWSSDNWRSDVYVYAHYDGTWTTHVAGRKRVGEIPEAPSFAEPINDDWMRRYREHMDAVEAAEMVDIGLAHDGKTFKDAGPLECAATLLMLKATGYHVPPGVIEDLESEAADMAAST